MENISKNLEIDYSKNQLNEQEANANPFFQFKKWFDEACLIETAPTAFTLATATATAFPSARILYLKEFDESGFVFYTNYKSRKGLEIVENPNGAMLFFWANSERQVRIEGRIEEIDNKQSDDYFAIRPRESQLASYASEQSAVIPNKQFLEERIEKLSIEMPDIIERPDWWGGYRLKPVRIEFWQGRPNRLNDRLLYTKSIEIWKINRLAP